MLELPQLQSVINALGWTLIHFLWQGLGIAGAYWLLMRLTRPEHALFRYWAGMSAFLLAALIPAATFLFYWLPESAHVGAVELTTSIAPVAGNMSLTFSEVLRFSMEPAIPALVVLWAIGVGFLTVRAVMGWYGASRLIRMETTEVSQSLKMIVQQLICQLGISQSVRVLKSTRVLVPTVVGWLKPVILLPAAVIARLPEDQLEMVLAHELGHIKRYDYLFNLLQLMIETLFFYHPAIRWMSGQVRQEREHCCDDVVLSHCKKPVLYARALANLEVLREPLPAVALAATGGDLVHRVHRIVQRELPGHHSGFAQLALMVGVAVMVSLGAHQGLQVRQQFIERDVAGAFQAITASGQDMADRSGWVQGITDWPGLAADKISRLQEENRARVAAMAAAQRAQSVLDVVEEAPDPGAQGDVDPDETTPAAMETSYFAEAHDLFAPVLPEPGMPDREALMLAGTFGPASKPEVPESTPEDNSHYQVPDFKLAAETVVAPVYPFKARRKHLNGFVRLEFSVTDEGKPRDIRVVEAQPQDVFEKSAISALQQWVFRVGEEHSQNRRLLQVFDFGMEEEAPVLSKRDRRCEIAGSRICGLQRYNEKNKIN